MYSLLLRVGVVIVGTSRDYAHVGDITVILNVKVSRT